jgi:hypothetical protein
MVSSIAEYSDDLFSDFGSLWLAEQHFPARFAANTGAPAFGIGVPYADFGDFAIVYWVLAAFLDGITMRLPKPDAGTFAGGPSEPVLPRATTV